MIKLVFYTVVVELLRLSPQRLPDFFGCLLGFQDIEDTGTRFKLIHTSLLTLR